MWRWEEESEKKAVKLGELCQFLHAECDILAELRSIALTNGVDDGNYEVLRLLRRSANKMGGIEKLVDVEFYECGILLQSMDEVVRPPVGLHLLGGGLGVTADELVQLLAIAARADGGHENLLGGHEGELGHDGGLDGAGIDDQAADDIDEQKQCAVDGEEGLGDGEALIGRVIQGALKPLLGGGLQGRGGEGDDEAG